MTRIITNDAEPGVNTEYDILATDPSDDEYPNWVRRFDEVWKVGKRYWDDETNDMCELTEVYLKSGRRSVGEPDTLVFALEYDKAFERIREFKPRVAHRDPDLRNPSDVFREQTSVDCAQPGAPSPPWPNR